MPNVYAKHEPIIRDKHQSGNLAVTAKGTYYCPNTQIKIFFVHGNVYSLKLHFTNHRRREFDIQDRRIATGLPERSCKRIQESV